MFLLESFQELAQVAGPWLPGLQQTGNRKAWSLSAPSTLETFGNEQATSSERQ